MSNIEHTLAMVRDLVLVLQESHELRLTGHVWSLIQDPNYKFDSVSYMIRTSDDSDQSCVSGAKLQYLHSLFHSLVARCSELSYVNGRPTLRLSKCGRYMRGVNIQGIEKWVSYINSLAPPNLVIYEDSEGSLRKRDLYLERIDVLERNIKALSKELRTLGLNYKPIKYSSKKNPYIVKPMKGKTPKDNHMSLERPLIQTLEEFKASKETLNRSATVKDIPKTNKTKKPYKKSKKPAGKKMGGLNGEVTAATLLKLLTSSTKK